MAAATARTVRAAAAPATAAALPPVRIPASDLRHIAAQYAAAPAVPAGEPGIAGSQAFYIDVSGLPAARRGALLGAAFAQATAMDPDLSVDRIQTASLPPE
ncbi:MAG: hypothetical protein ACK559_35480, partial [bacterium]